MRTRYSLGQSRVPLLIPLNENKSQADILSMRTPYNLPCFLLNVSGGVGNTFGFPFGQTLRPTHEQ